MSYNSNLYYKYNSREKSTFQSYAPMFVPPPPAPPTFFIPPAHGSLDDELIKQFENQLPSTQPAKLPPSTSISKVRDEIRNLALALKDIRMKEKMLSEKINDISDEEWSSSFKQIEQNKAVVSEILSNINNLNADVLRKLLAKRSAKRARQKRQRIEKRKEKEIQRKQDHEKSLKINEYLQKFQDDMNRSKQEEEAKFEADLVLRETIHKKQDAKKYIVKLDALVKLRKARQNTAKGRGAKVSEKEAEVFENNIEKLKAMWAKRLAMYKQEETDLREKLKMNSEDFNTSTNETEREVRDNLDEWKEAMFGGTLPQVDFAGDIGRFVQVRSRWDQYLNHEGSSIPIGWVPPTAKMSECEPCLADV